MNTNSNTYTMVFASIMVVIVALILALVSDSLKDIQKKNVELDKKKQILASLNIDTKDQDVEALYAQYIIEEIVINSAAEIVESPEEEAFNVDVKKELAKDLNKRALPLYIAEIDDETKYILSLYGAGLWGPIWGYIALEEDKNSIYGAYFSHASETPGLGDEIAQTSFQHRFIGKKIFNDMNEFVSVAIVKSGQSTDRQDYVDGVSGGTITSQGVENMLFNCMSQYEAYLQKDGGNEE